MLFINKIAALIDESQYRKIRLTELSSNSLVVSAVNNRGTLRHAILHDTQNGIEIVYYHHTQLPFVVSESEFRHAIKACLFEFQTVVVFNPNK